MASRVLDEEWIEYYYDIAKGISHGEDRMEEAQKTIESKEYQTIANNLKQVKEDMRANDIFLVYVNQEILLSYEEGKEWVPLTYLFDCFDGPEGPFKLGRQGAINPKFINEAYYVITTGERSSNHFVSQSFHGYNISALLPIPVYDDYLILCVEIPMQYITETFAEYWNHAVFISIGIILAVIIVFLIYYYFILIKPIRIITNETKQFAANRSLQSSSLEKMKWKNEIGDLAKSIHQMEQDIISYIENLKMVTREQEKLSAELSIATQIQMSMLPNVKEMKKYDTFEIAASMNPAKAVGGDFYDFFMIDEVHLAVVIADVSGKGIPAALFMVIGKTLLKEYTKSNSNPAAVFNQVNQILCESNKEGLFITAFEGILNLVTGDFYYANAGHEMPFIKKQDFKPYPIEPDFVLAGFENMIYETGHFILSAGDKLFLYTDGVPEATNIDNELFGMNRLEEALRQSQQLSPMAILNHIQNTVDEYVGDAPQFDDITMLCLELKRLYDEKNH